MLALAAQGKQQNYPLKIAFSNSCTAYLSSEMGFVLDAHEWKMHSCGLKKPSRKWAVSLSHFFVYIPANSDILYGERDQSSI